MRWRKPAANRIPFGLFALPFPFALAFSLPGIIPVKSPFELMELPRSRLDAEVLGDDTPSLALDGLVLLEHNFLGLSRHLAHLQHHVGVRRHLYTGDEDLHLRHRNSERRRQPGREPRPVRARLDIQVGEEDIQVAAAEAGDRLEQEKSERGPQYKL